MILSMQNEYIKISSLLPNTRENGNRLHKERMWKVDITENLTTSQLNRQLQYQTHHSRKQKKIKNLKIPIKPKTLPQLLNKLVKKSGLVNPQQLLFAYMPQQCARKPIFAIDPSVQQ